MSERLNAEVGQEIGSAIYEITRADLVRYAGASGDFNPIHWNERFAKEVGLDGVIAHGMYTMGRAINVVADWCGDPARIIEYGTRFSKPVPVPDPGHATLEVSGKVGAVDADVARIDLTVTVNGAKVLMKARAKVKLI